LETQSQGDMSQGDMSQGEMPQGDMSQGEMPQGDMLPCGMKESFQECYLLYTRR